MIARELKVLSQTLTLSHTTILMALSKTLSEIEGSKIEGFIEWVEGSRVEGVIAE